MQSWNSKGMESINEVKVKAPGSGGGKWRGFVDHGDWNFGQEFQFRHSMGRVEVRNGWGHEGRAAKVKGWTFRTVSWSGARGHRAEKKKQFDSWGGGGRADVFWQCAWHSFLNGHERTGEGVWHMHLVYVQPGSWKWAWSQGKRVGRQMKWRETTTEKNESDDWLPAQDDLELAAVELPSVGQTHDALLVARQVLHVYLLEDRQDSQYESSETPKASLGQFRQMQISLSVWLESKQAVSWRRVFSHVGLLHCSLVESLACGCLLTLSH